MPRATRAGISLIVMVAAVRITGAVAPTAAAGTARPQPANERQAAGAVLRGRAFIAQGRHAQAIASYLEAIRLAPDFAQSYSDLGVEYVRLRRWGDAEEQFRRLARLLPNDPRPLIQLAAVQAQSGETGGARDTLATAVDRYPSHPELRLAYADALEKDHQTAAAEAQLRAATEQAPKSVDAWRALTAFYLRHKRDSDFEQAAARLFALTPSNGALAFDLGLLAQKRKAWARASSYYHAAVRMNPKNAAAWQNLGGIYMELKRPKEAAAAFARAAGMGSGNFRAEMGLGINRFSAGDFSGAESAFRRAARLNPNDSSALINLAAALMRERKSKEAIAVYERLRARGNADLAVMESLAYLYATTGRARDAIALYHRAIERQPDRVALHRALASMYLTTQQYPLAIDEFKTVHRLDPKETATAGMLGALYRQTGKTDDAIAFFTELAKTRPAAYADLAELHRSKKQEDAQVADLRAWTVADPKNPAGWVALSSALEGQKKLPEAREALESALKLDPGSVPVARAASGFFVRMGNPGRSIEILREAARSHPAEPSLHASMGDLLESSDPSEAANEFRLAEAQSKDPRVAATYGLRVAQMLAKTAAPDLDAQYLRLLKLYPDDPTPHLRWGETLAARGKLAEAIDQARWVVVHQPNAYPEGFQAMNDLTTWARQAGRLETIVPVLERVVEANPGNSQAAYALAAAYVGSDTAKHAPPTTAAPGYSALHRLAASHPDRPILLWALADYAAQRAMTRERIAALERLSTVEPASPAAPAALGGILRDQGELERAASQFREAARRAPQTAFYASALGQVLESAGRQVEALAAYRAAQKADPNDPLIRQAVQRLEKRASGTPAVPAPAAAVPLTGGARRAP